MKTLAKYLIESNKELVNKTAMSNCHCIGLNSFIINEKPRIRLFVAERNCELFGIVDYKNPKIPIHPHKYDDTFLYIGNSTVTHHIWAPHNKHETDPDVEIVKFGKYEYPRISDKTEIKKVGESELVYVGSFYNLAKLNAEQLHSVTLHGPRCSWMVIETFEDKDFKQIAYHKNLVKRDDLYVPMENGFDYLQNEDLF